MANIKSILSVFIMAVTTTSAAPSFKDKFMSALEATPQGPQYPPLFDYSPTNCYLGPDSFFCTAVFQGLNITGSKDGTAASSSDLISAYVTSFDDCATLRNPVVSLVFCDNTGSSDSVLCLKGYNQVVYNQCDVPLTAKLANNVKIPLSKDKALPVKISIEYNANAPVVVNGSS